MMRILILMLLLTCSCVSSRPYISYKERCSISFKFKTCICYDYDLMSAKRVSEPVKHPIEKCEDITGFHAKDWLESITPWAHENIRMYNDSKD